MGIVLFHKGRWTSDVKKQIIKYIVFQSIGRYFNSIRAEKYLDIIGMEEWYACCTRPNRIFRPNSKTSLVVSFGHKFRPYIRLLNVKLRKRAQMTQVLLVFATQESYGNHIWEQEVVFHYINLKWSMILMLSEATGFPRMFLRESFQFLQLHINFHFSCFVLIQLQDKIKNFFLRY